MEEEKEEEGYRMMTLLRLCSGQGNGSEDHQEHEHEGLRAKTSGFRNCLCDVIKKARAGGVLGKENEKREKEGS